MRFFLYATFLVMIATSTAFSQTPKPTATPETDTDIVKISTSLIQVDVTVTDSKGNPVTDLRPEEVEVFENGAKQTITNFSFITAGTKPEDNANKDQKATAVISSPYRRIIKRSEVRRTLALVVDDLTLSSTSIRAVRNGLRQYVNEQMQPGDLVAIIKTGGGSGIFQQFTSDKTILLEAIKQIKWNPYGNGGLSAFSRISVEDNAAGPEDVKPSPPNEGVVPRIFESLKGILRGMKPLPGRKSMMLVSEGFVLNANPALELETLVRNESDTATTRDLGIALELIRLANRSSVVIYSMDARGVVDTGFSAADNTSINQPSKSPILSQRFSRFSRERTLKLADTRSGLKLVAEETGGLAIFNNNDIGAGIKRVIDDQSYYLVGYQPEEDTFDPRVRRFNKLEVRVKRKGVKVRYRSGFFSETQSDRDEAKNRNEPKIVTAIRSPLSLNAIKLRLNGLFSMDTSNRMLVRSFLHIDANDLTFVDVSDGTKTATVEVLAGHFKGNGDIENQFSKIHTIAVKPGRLPEIRENGLIYHFVFPVEKSGPYQMSVAVRDTSSDKTGTASQFLSIPKLDKSALVLSGIVLENLTFDQWKVASSRSKIETTPILDNANRRFKRGSVLNYGLDIFHPNLKSVAGNDLKLRTRLFYEGRLIYEGKDSPASLSDRKGNLVSAAGSIRLPENLNFGSYVLQVLVTDTRKKKKPKTATQFIQFEIVG